MSSTLQALSNELAAAVERASAFVVAVHGRADTPSSGVIWRPNLVVTADHTLTRDEDVWVEAGGKRFEATVAGRDEGTDLALLQMGAPEVPEAERATEFLRAAAMVLAVGRGPSVSLGIVSAIGGPWRTWRGGHIDRMIRLDLAIYTGFSGGALIDAQGKVAGVNTSGLARGAAVAVPAATVDRVVEQLLNKGHVAKGYLGIGAQPVRIPESLASRLGLQAQTGLMVLSVEPEAPADKAGVLMGDVILEMDGRRMAHLDDLQGALAPDRIGRAVQARLLRAGSVIELSVIVGEKPWSR
jgi:S1-C subfamily serine protease